MPIVLLGVLVLGALAIAAAWPGFVPKTVAISGNRIVTRHEILTRAAILPHLSIWLQNTAAIGRRVEAIPYIATAAVHRLPPSELRIVVTERVPFALVESGSEAAIVDRSLRVLQPTNGDENLPLFVLASGVALVPGAYLRAPSAAELRDAYEAIAARGMTAAQLALDRFGGIVVTEESGVRLMLGTPSDLSEKLALAQAITAQLVARERRVAAIDLRAPSAPVLVYR